MDSREAIKANLDFADMVVQSYLGDLTDDDLLVRPVDGANHIAWQLGHLITAEHDLIEGVAPGSMPPLPEGFKEKHAKETSSSDDKSGFLGKAKYLELWKQQREGTLAALAKTSDDDLSKPSPEHLRQFFPTVGAVLSMQGGHAVMHAGQWAVIRRKLGKPPLF